MPRLMIISHKHRYIFVKTNKTAGTSIELALAPFCGPDDILTPLTREDEEIRKAFKGVGPQNFLASPLRYSLKDLAILVLRGEQKKRFYSHISATNIQKEISPEIWNGYTKFCFERNPWDRVVSHYYWYYRKHQAPPSISEYLHSEKVMLLKQRGRGLYTINNQVVVDHIGRFENLHHDLAALGHKIGLPDDFELPRAKGKSRKDTRPYQQILNTEERNKIAEIFADEIEMMGYSY